MFGGALTVPVPDVDRTDFLLMLGANPYESNGSLATAPDWPGGWRRCWPGAGPWWSSTPAAPGPRRWRPARAVRPGADPFLLMALVNVLAAEGLVDPGPAGEYLTGVDEVLAAAEPFTPRPSRTRPASTPARSARWPATWPPPPPPASTAASAPPRPCTGR